MVDSKEKKLYFSSANIEMKSIDFSAIDFDKKLEPDKISIIIRDTYDIVSVEKDNFKAKYTRKVELDPKILFEITVSYNLIFNFEKKTIKEFENNHDELINLVNEKAIKALEMSGVISKASAVIASITMNNNGNPVITPPTYQK